MYEVDLLVLAYRNDIVDIKNNISEKIHIDNYLCVVVNIMFLVEYLHGKFVDLDLKMALVDLVLQDLHELQIYKHENTRFIHGIYKLSSAYWRLEIFNFAYGNEKKTPLLYQLSISGILLMTWR